MYRLAQRWSVGTRRAGIAVATGVLALVAGVWFAPSASAAEQHVSLDNEGGTLSITIDADSSDDGTVYYTGEMNDADTTDKVGVVTRLFFYNAQGDLIAGPKEYWPDEAEGQNPDYFQDARSFTPAAKVRVEFGAWVWYRDYEGELRRETFPGSSSAEIAVDTG